VSLAGEQLIHYQTAAAVVLQLLEKLKNHPLPVDTILNVNVPDVPLEQLQGIHATRLGRRHKSEPVVKQTDPRGKPIYWVGPVGPEEDAGPGSDFFAIRNKVVSVTPIQVDLTRYEAIETVAHWLQG
jgi:5'-nucleotidase